MSAVRRSKKKRLSAEERRHRRAQRVHANLIRNAFRACGFQHIIGAADKEFCFKGATSDFDDILVFENVIIIAEYTLTQQSGIGAHLKNKKIIYDIILNNKIEFFEFLQSEFFDFKAKFSSKYKAHQCRVICLYCAKNEIKQSLKDLVPNVIYYDYNIARYFEVVTRTLRKTARFEMFAFLGLKSQDVGDSVHLASGGVSSHSYPCSILPETYSNLGEGYKVVSFYADPASLLRRAYVLRKQGWRAEGNAYQRMVIKAKIGNVRRYLREQKRVFVNNIIVTLPEDTKLLDREMDTIAPREIQDTQPGTIQIPDRFNSIGIVDGQHRVFSYHEGGLYEEEIAKLRSQQNLLVTGILFPRDATEIERRQFEARLFLEINSKQSSTKPALIQELTLLIHPFSLESLAKRVVSKLNDSHGPLQDTFERYFFDTDKLKTTSIVSFQVRPLVNPAGASSLFARWSNPRKVNLNDQPSENLMEEYVAFCAEQINAIFAAVRAVLPNERWTSNRDQEDRFLTTANVNGVIACLRRLASEDRLTDTAEYRKALGSLGGFKFQDYKSSQYNKMGAHLYESYFK